jgi:hypothetical protein
VFDPVSILFAVKSGLDPSTYTVLRPDPAYLKQERFGNCLGRIGAILFALGWFVVVPSTGVLAFFFPNPLARAGVYLFYFSITLGSLAEIFVFMPRRPARQSRQVLIVAPDGLILADYEHSEVLGTIDYRAIDKLTLEEDTDIEVHDLYRLIVREHGRWTIQELLRSKTGGDWVACDAGLCPCQRAWDRLSVARRRCSSGRWARPAVETPRRWEARSRKFVGDYRCRLTARRMRRSLSSPNRRAPTACSKPVIDRLLSLPRKPRSRIVPKIL